MNISLVMCSYNRAQYIREQLDSFARQTRPPDELIVSDDHSSDGTVPIIEEFASSAPFPVNISVNHENIGVMKNFGKAIGLSKGDVIALSDSDDVWHADKLELTERVLLSAPDVGLVFSDMEIVDASLNPVGLSFWQSAGFNQKRKNLVSSGKAFDLFLAHSVVAGPTMAFRSHFKDLILPMPPYGPLFQDGWILLIIAAIARLAFIDKSTMKYRQHSAQLCGVQKTSTVQRMLRPHKTEPEYYLSLAAQFEEVYNRLTANGGNLTDHNNLSRLREKVRHLHARAMMPPRRVSRLPGVLKELGKLNYHRYSRGWLSAAKDLMV